LGLWGSRQRPRSPLAAHVDDQKARESRLRREAARQGLGLVKSRSRDPRAIDFAGFMIVNVYTDTAEAGDIGSARTLNLDEVGEYLDAARKRARDRREALDAAQAALMTDDEYLMTHPPRTV
jgi:hypothetical protein